MSYFKFIVLLTHPKLAVLALPLSTSREGARPPADVGWVMDKYDIKLFRLLIYNFSTIERKNNITKRYCPFNSYLNRPTAWILVSLSWRDKILITPYEVRGKESHFQQQPWKGWIWSFWN